MAKESLKGLQQAMKAPSKQTPIGVTPDGSVAAYQGPDQGPFECDDCQFFDESSSGCSRPEVLKEVGDPDKDGLADVDPHGCCNFFTKEAE